MRGGSEGIIFKMRRISASELGEILFDQNF